MIYILHHYETIIKPKKAKKPQQPNAKSQYHNINYFVTPEQTHSKIVIKHCDKIKNLINSCADDVKRKACGTYHYSIAEPSLRK